MTVADVGIRRVLMVAIAAVVLFAMTTAISNHRADAAYPGGSDWIVFENNEGSSDAELFVVPADGSASPVNVTDDLSFQADPVFSPDGTMIAFASDHGPNSSIYVTDFDPSGPSIDAIGAWVQVSSGGIDGEPTWAPDGTTLAFQRQLPVTLSDNVDSDHATNLTDAAATFVTDGVRPGMSVRNNSTATNGLVVSVNSQTSLTTDIAWTDGDSYTVTVSHSRIFTAAADGTDSGSETQLGDGTTPLVYSDFFPAWDPDGSLIAFTTNRNGNADIYTFTTTGTSPANLTGDGATGIDAYASRPSWSPDGDFVAFQTAEPGSDQNVWKVDRAGTTATQVTTATTEDVEPAWSPDGASIAFRNGGDGLIYTVGSNGGTPAVLTTASDPAGSHNTPDWQPALTGVDDTDTVDEHGTINIDVLANDLGLLATYGTLDTSATLVADPTRGTVTHETDGTFTYEHTGPEIGTSAVTDTFTYTVTQGSDSSTAEVTVTINPVDDDPTADADGPYPVDHGGTIDIAAGDGVLVGDADPEGLGLSAVLVDDVTKGTLSLAANGSFTYTNDGASTSATTDTFTYMAEDPAGNMSPETTVTIDVGAENPNPPVVTISGPAFGALSEEVTFESAVTDGSGPRTFAWSVTNNGASVATGAGATLDFTPAMTGVHTVTVTVEDSAGLDTDSFDFTVMTDITGNTFANDIIWLANEGITKGCNPPVNDEYCPDDRVTRGQMAAFLVRFLGLTDNGGGDLFTDDDGSLFEDNIDKLATAGVTRGCNPPTNDNFCPNDFVTRGQMAAFMVRALGLTDNGGGDLFTDDDGTVFENNIDILATAGITRGCNPPTNDLFCPNDFVTRGQMAAFLHRADALK